MWAWGRGPPAGPAFVRPPTELSSGSWSEMWTQTLSLKWEGEAPAMIGASKGLTAQPGRKVGAPVPLSSQAVRALPQMLSRQTQERGSGGCRCPPQARGKGHVTEVQPQQGQPGDTGTSRGEATSAEEGPRGT